MMRYSILFLILLYLPQAVFSQEDSPLDQLISIEVENKTIKSTLREISRTYDLKFLYSSSIIPVNKKVSLNEKQVPLRKVLDKMFTPDEIEYHYTGRKILLTRKKTKDYVIQGTITDVYGMPIPGVIITLDSNLKALSTYDGSFSFSNLSPGIHQLTFRMIGYETLQLKYDRNSPLPLQIKMKSTAIKLEEAIVNADPIIGRVAVSDVALTKTDLETNKGFSNDPLRTISSLPGISNKDTPSGSNQLYVKGGDANETTFYLDNAPVYWPWYYIGKSVFNIETLEKAEVLTGGFSANYGNSMSAVLNLKSKDGNLKEYGISASMGYYDFQFTSEGPIIKNKVSYLVSARRSYLDYIFKVASPVRVPSFTDLTHRVVWQINSKNKITLSGVNTCQDYRFINDSILVGDPMNIHFNGQVNTESLQWQSTISRRWYNKASVVYSALKSDIQIDRNFNHDINGRSLGIRNDLTHFINARQRLKMGMEGYVSDLQTNGFLPLNPLTESTTDSSVILVDKSLDQNLYSAGLYFLYEGNISKQLVSNIGIRADHQFINGNTDLSPRLALGYQLSNHLKLRASIGIFHQPATAQDISQNANLGSNRSIHYITGLSYNSPKGFDCWIEGFYKSYSNLVVFDSLLNYSNDGFGHSSGVAGIVKKKTGKFTGWISYTFSISRRKNYLQEAVHFFFRDQRHVLNTVIKYSLPTKKSAIVPNYISLDYRFLSGTPYTQVVGAALEDDIWTPQFGDPFSERNPAYHNLNLKIEWRGRYGKQKKLGFNYFIQIWNLLNFKNIDRRVYDYGYQYNNNVNEVIRYGQNRLISIGFRADFNRPL